MEERKLKRVAALQGPAGSPAASIAMHRHLPLLMRWHQANRPDLSFHSMPATVYGTRYA